MTPPVPPAGDRRTLVRLIALLLVDLVDAPAAQPADHLPPDDVPPAAGRPQSHAVARNGSPRSGRRGVPSPPPAGPPTTRP